MKIGIFISKNKIEAENYAGRLDSALKNGAVKRGIDIETVKFYTSKSQPDSDAYDGLSMGIAIGGDGTFLHGARFAALHNFPILGINFGKLGFLTDINKNSLEETVDVLLDNKYTIENRKVLRINVKDSEGNIIVDEFALNDCAIQRDIFSKIMYADLYINGLFVNSYAADGMLVATQTGSTAYSYSAGGPIVEPGCDVALVTPICSHFTDSHSIVVNSTSVIEIKFNGKHPSIALTADGRINRFFKPGETVLCRLDPDRLVRIIRINPPTFYQTLAVKLKQRGVESNGEK